MRVGTKAEWRLWLLRGVYYVLWASIPLFFALLLWIGWLREVRYLWEGLLYLWTAVSLLVFLHALISPRSGQDHSVLRGLIATVSLGLPAAGLTLLGFSLSFADLPLALDEKEENLAIDQFKSLESEGPRAFIFAIDRSQSVMPRTNEDKLKIVENVLDKVLLGDEPLIPQNSCVILLAFASKPEVVETLGQFGSAQCADFRINVDGMTAKFVKRLRQKSLGQETATTDLLGVLSSLVGYIDEHAKRYSRISVLLLSDLYHDVGIAGRQSTDREELDHWESIERAIGNLRQHVQFMVLLDDGPGQMRRAGFHLRIQQNGVRERWREIRLEEYKSADREQQAALLALNLFPATETKPLHLKYMIGPQRVPISSRIQLPPRDAFRHIVLGLAAGPGEEGSMSRVRLRVQDWPYREVVLFTDPASQRCLLNQVGTELTLTLDNPTDLGRTILGNLMLAVPKEGQVFRVPIEIVPVLPQNSRLFFKVLVSFGAGALLLLALRADRDGLLGGGAL